MTINWYDLGYKSAKGKIFSKSGLEFTCSNLDSLKDAGNMARESAISVTEGWQFQNSIGVIIEKNVEKPGVSEADKGAMYTKITERWLDGYEDYIRDLDYSGKCD